MTDRPFHHGNLRAALLDEAEQQLRLHGLDGLSLRELAKQAGVTHSAPRRHFPDRRSLLTALAERALRRLIDDMEAALDSAPDDPVQRFKSAAQVFVEHATRDSALMDLMFDVPTDGRSTPLADSTRDFAALVRRTLHADSAEVSSDLENERQQMLVAATLRGLAGFLAAGRIDQPTADAVIEDAARLFTARRPPAS